MTDPTVCLMYAPILTLFVGLMKRIPFVRKSPKVVASLIALAVGIWRASHGDMPGFDFAVLVECVGVLLSGAVATHEIVVKPVTNQFAVGLVHPDYVERK